jgi:tetratricopeptide (TPR) repeat protein
MNESGGFSSLDKPVFTKRQGRLGKAKEVKTASLYLAKCVVAKDDNETLDADSETIRRSLEYAYNNWKRKPNRSNEWPDRDREFLGAVMNLARYLEFRSNFRDRVTYGMQALEVAAGLNDKAAEIELCASTISWPLLQMGDLAGAEVYSQKGYDLAIGAGKWREAALAARTLSGIFRDQSTGHPKSNAANIQLAQKWAGKAFHCARRCDDRDLRLSAIVDHANAAMLKGAWRRAERGYRLMVSDLERRSPIDVERLAARLGDLGHVMICQGKVDEAEGYYRRSEALLRSFYSEFMKAELTFNFAAVARARGRIAEAETLAAAGRNAFQKLGIIRDARVDQYLKIAALYRSAVDQGQRDSLRPVEGVHSPLSFDWSTTNQNIVVVGSGNLPALPLPTSERDHAQRLEACDIAAQDLCNDVLAAKYNIRKEYLDYLTRYAKRLPKSAGQGNILLADNEAQILRKMFASDASILPLPFSASLTTLLHLHMGLRVYYPELARYYEDVRSGRVERPLPLDAVAGFFAGVRANTPEIFDPTVSTAINEATPPLPTTFPPEDAPPLDPTVPVPPPDPLGEVDLKKSRDYSVAGYVNELWKVFCQGPTIVKNLNSWNEAYHFLRDKVGPVLDWLRQFLQTDGGPPTPPPTIV